MLKLLLQAIASNSNIKSQANCNVCAGVTLIRFYLVFIPQALQVTPKMKNGMPHAKMSTFTLYLFSVNILRYPLRGTKLKMLVTCWLKVHVKCMYSVTLSKIYTVDLSVRSKSLLWEGRLTLNANHYEVGLEFPLAYTPNHLL